MFLLSPFGPWQSSLTVSFFLFVLPLFSWCLSVNIQCILEKMCEWVGGTYGRRSSLAFCFVFLLFYAIWPCMLSVQCIISQTASTGLLQFWVSAGRHRGTGPNELAHAEGRHWVRQRLQVRKTAIGQLWLILRPERCQVRASDLPLGAVT